MRSILALAWLVAFAAVPTRAAAQAQPGPRELARAIAARYDRLSDFRADFVHVYEGGVLRRRATERGTVLIKKPGRMRWEYTAPERKLFVSDGVKLYSYILEDRQVIVTSLPPGNQAGAAVLLLAGKGSLLRDFSASAPEAADRPAGTWAVRLIPVVPQPDYDWVVIAVDPATLTMRTLLTGDAQGGRSTFTFSGVRENTGLSDREFRFVIPRGVEVITDERRAP